MTALTELKQQADHLGLAPEMVRLYGDLRAKATWEKAITANKTITVDAVEVSAVEISDDEISEVVEKIYIDLREQTDEIIPFTHESDVHLPPSRREIMLEEVERQRGIFENAINCPPPPPPAPIIRTCPVPERQAIPGIEITERESPSPGIGRGEERFKNIGDRLFEKIQSDIKRYFESVRECLKHCLSVNYLDQQYYDWNIEIVELLEWNINNKSRIYDIWATIPSFKAKCLNDSIPFSLHEYFTGNTPPVDHWQSTRQTYWLIVEKPAPIPILSDDFGGVFIPNKIHELGNYIYVWKFPGAIQCENFFHHITNASDYAIIPANQDIQITQKQLELVGV